MELSQPEIRVLGCLLEKQRTTPDQYPLSLNALRLACNQSTSRHPVVEYDEPTIRDALHRLERRGLTRFASGAGSRAPKYRHLLSEALPMSDPEQAAMCVLMLRDAQTPGELKQRCERLYPFGDLEEVHRTLSALIERGLVERLERRPGQKEERYRHLLGDDDAPVGGSAPGVTGAASASAGPGSTYSAPQSTASAAAPVASGERGNGNGARPSPSSDDLLGRVERLEREVEQLRAALSERVP